MEFWRIGVLLVSASLHDSTAPITPVFSVFVLCWCLIGYRSLTIGHSPKALAASPGFAPRCLRTATIRFQRTAYALCASAPRAGARVFDWLASRSSKRSEERRLVARKGSAPPTSGCRPDVILF